LLELLAVSITKSLVWLSLWSYRRRRFWCHRLSGLAQ